MPRPEEYLKPEIIRQIARLDLKARFIVEGFLSGLHASPFHGFSVEFSEHRKYSPGDDLKNIDWSVYAKTDRFYVKKFEAETVVDAYLLMDLSESMAFGKPLSKFEYSVYLAASLGYLMNKQQDRVGLALFDESVRVFMPARNKRAHLIGLLGHLAAAETGGRTDLVRAISDLAHMIKHRGLIMLFSDLLAGKDEVIDAVGRLRYRGHDVIVFHVLDSAERTFPYEDFARFIDPETGENLQIDPRAARRAYLDALGAFEAELREIFVSERIDYVPIDTAVTFDRALVSFLANRRSHYL